jgi:hypothetical protein
MVVDKDGNGLGQGRQCWHQLSTNKSASMNATGKGVVA